MEEQDYLPVSDADGWVRNKKTNSIQCSDSQEYEKFMKSYYADQRKKKDFETLQNEVSELKSDMSDIKSLLLTLVQNNKGLNYDD